jgi:hypothetical protein
LVIFEKIQSYIRDYQLHPNDIALVSSKVEWLMPLNEAFKRSEKTKVMFEDATERDVLAARMPFAVSVACSRASEEANQWPANPRQHTTSGLECSRGQQRTEREKRRKVRRERQLREVRAQEAKAGNRTNTGGTGKKNPNRIRVGISHYGGAGGI